MAGEPIKQLLKDFGLTETEAELYLFLSKHGASKGTEIAKQVKKDKAQVYHILRSLQAKGLVESTLEAPVRFTPVPFEHVVESTISAKRAEAERIESTKNELLRYWKNLDKGKSETPSERFTVIEGRHRVYSKISQMIQDAKRQLSTITTVSNLMKAEGFGLYNVASKHPLKSQIQYRVLTDFSKQDMKATQKILEKMSKRGFNFKGKTPELGQSLFPQMVIRDGEEVVFFINPVGQDGTTDIRDDVCLWTNCRSLVQAFGIVFEEWWRSSKDLQKRMEETRAEKGEQNHVIHDAEEAREKYSEALQAAQRDVLVVTSPEGLFELRDLLSKGRADGRVLKRIMAPITNDNISVVQELTKYGQVRHIPKSSMGTTIVDERCMFQFKYSTSEHDGDDAAKSGGKVCFEDVFYSDDAEHVGKAKVLLEDFWNNAQSPSHVTLEVFNRATMPSVSETEDRLVSMNRKIKGATVLESGFPSPVTEKEILDKVMNQGIPPTTKIDEIARTFGSNAQAIVHLPPEFNLPSILLHLLHMDKRSTFGAEDVVAIHFWLNTPMGETYVPVALITDNPDTVDFWRSFLAGSPAAQNVQLLGRDKLEINVHGSVLFAGWTVPISIPPHTLPPSCVLIEGSGRIKPSAFAIQAPSGFIMKTEYNGCDAFVTFLHPSSKYSGPGTDGLLGRDAIMEFHHPENKKSVASK